MKRIFLTLFFASYYFFMPFVMIHCGVEDRPYAVDASVSASDAEYTYEECEEMEFLIEECIDVLQDE